MKLSVLVPLLYMIIYSINSYAVGRGSLDVGLTFSVDDNAAREETKFSDTVVTFVSNLAMDSNSNFVDTELKYSANYSEYQENSFSDRRATDGFGRILLHSSAYTFTWLFENEEKDLLADVTEVDTPNNRRQQSVYGTGPSLNLRLSPLDHLSTGAYFKTNHIEDGKSDTERTIYNLNWRRDISRKLQFGLGGEKTDIELDDSVERYDNSRAYLELRRRISRGSIIAKWGRAKTKLVDSETEFEGDEYQLTLSHRGDYGEFFVDVGRSITDSGESSFRSIDQPNFIFGNDRFKLLEEREVEARYILPRTSYGQFDFVLSRMIKTDELAAAEETLETFKVGWLKRLSAIAAFTFEARYQELVFEEVLVGDEESSQTLDFKIGMNRDFFFNTKMNCIFRHQKRYGGVNNGYKANSFQCGFKYRIF